MSPAVIQLAIVIELMVVFVAELLLVGVKGVGEFREHCDKRVPAMDTKTWHAHHTVLPVWRILAQLRYLEMLEGKTLPGIAAILE